MTVLAHDFYDPSDPDTLIGTLDDTQLKINEIRPALFELGAARIAISRHLAVSEQGGFLQKGLLVRTRIPEVSEDAIWGWILKDGDFNLISHREQGGENLHFSGPGLLYMLTWGRLYEEWYAPGQPGRGSTTAQEPGQWVWLNEPYGAILTRLIEEGQFQDDGPLQHITHDFDRDDDSDGNPWDIIAEQFRVPTGTDMLTVANRLAAAGNLYLELTPDLVLHARQSVGRDLTGSFGAGNVRFQKGINLLTELTRKTRKDHLTHLITQDADEVFALHVVPGFSGQAKYGYLDVPQSNDATYVATVAQHALESSATESEEYALEITPGDDETAGLYLYGPEGSNGHFYLGDDVTVHTGTAEHDLNASAQRVIATRITVDAAAADDTSDRAQRSLHIVPELSYRAAPNFNWRTTAEEQGATGDPGYCCGPRICTGTTVEGGDGLLDFDWEDEPDHDETIPAIAALSQPDITISGGTALTGPLVGLHRISFPAATAGGPDGGDIDGSDYTWFHATPGQAYTFDLEYLTFAHLSAPEVGAVWIQWLSGSFGAYGHISNDYVELPRQGSFPVNKAFTLTAPTGATGVQFWQGRETGADRGWHLHGIVLAEGGTVVDCPDGSAAAAGHSHSELHSTHSVEELLTTETDDALVLAPDGDGGVEWVTPPSGSGAPDDATYLVTAAHAGLSAEVAVGATPGGELGGTWAAPTVDATHSGSTHGAAVTTHEAAGDPHTGYRLESADHSHASTGLQGGTLDHGVLTGLADDDHPQYMTDAEHTATDHDAIVGNPDWPLQARATADQDVTNNATPQASTFLTMTLDASSVYEFDFTLIWSCTSALAKARWRYASSAAIQWDGRAAFGWQQSLSSAGASADPLGAIGASGGGTQWPAADQIDDLPGASDGLGNRYVTHGRFSIVTPGSSTTITLQFANNATGAGNTTRLEEGSVLRGRKLV